MRLLQDKTVRGRRYRVYASGIAKIVRVGEGDYTQSVVMPPGWRTGFYYDRLADAMKGRRSVLVLGNGAGSLANLLHGKARVVGVEPDPEMNRIAAELGTAGRCTVVETDALDYLRSVPVTFDGVVVDCYVEHLPAPLFDDIVAEARSLVAGPGGVLAVNRFDAATGENRIEVERFPAPEVERATVPKKTS
jgi:spermidine synthase